MDSIFTSEACYDCPDGSAPDNPCAIPFYNALSEASTPWTIPVKNAFNALLSCIADSSGTATKELVIQIGTPSAALTDGRTPDYSFPNGTTFTIAALIGMVPTAVRVDNSPYSPIAGQYSFSTTTGTTTFGDVLNDCYIFMKPQVFSGTPPEGAFTYTFPFTLS